jgi:3-deoxy-D-arabino-heptulosonate 7-phosphate (DAHP) synthase class II
MGFPEGTADLLYIGRNGAVHFLEVKNETGKPSQEQINFIRVMNECHVKSGIVRSVSDALELIDCTNPNRKI